MVGLAGKAALVTGGAGGIGAACVRRLARAGARVAVLDLDEAGAHRLAAEIDGLPLAGDVTDPATLPAAVARVEQELGRLDVVHLNAGLGGAQQGLDDSLDVASYRRLMGVNVDHVVFGVCAAVPALRRAGGGTIVVTASLAGLGPMPADALYTASKHAAIGYVRAAGEALAEEGIRVVALCPGYSDTALLGGAREQLTDAGYPLLSPEQVADAFEAVLEHAEPGSAWVLQDGREPGPYKFRGLPGPASGQRPPDVRLGAR
ncbi:short chain dehydrogenase [Longimycelium tulufanense]|uniref:Short chain dehydrogenase n=1 Tax=Longimycelium tulufanense TaxID=907463 RepID=A0A8J3CCF9_9PSEU|nr:SDR family NAD(P)-dependent oxidoreductase [Longimycelium tulufanense]GGM73779.1 short chain dehydrogenase [Longimycelium tulufanense]